MIARLLNRLLWPLQREAVRFGYVDGLNKAWGFVNEAISDSRQGDDTIPIADRVFTKLEIEMRKVIYDRSYP